VFLSGLFLLVLGLIGLFFAIVPPVESLRVGAIGVAFGCGLSGLLLVYLGWPSGRKKAPEGKRRAKATILEAKGTPGSVAGYQMVEVTLEVSPKGGIPYEVKQKFSSGRIGVLRQGRKIDVAYDPVNPEKIELI
jgi:uncharacterized protein DUF3592